MAVSETDSRNSVDVTGNKTLAATDAGIVQNVTASCTLTLPSTVVGLPFIVRNGGSGSTDQKVTINISPASVDQIIGNGFTATDNKDAINTLGNGGVDEMCLLGDGSLGWYVQYANGVWTREA